MHSRSHPHYYSYAISSKVFFVNDKPRPNDSVVLEQYMNDVYHFFLAKLTAYMQSDAHLGAREEAKLKDLFEEIIKTRTLIKETK